MRKLFLTMFVLFSLFFIYACTDLSSNPLLNVDIDAVDQFDIEAGIYEIPFTIEDLDRLMAEYDAILTIRVQDQDGNEVDVTGQSIEVIAGYVYTVNIRVQTGQYSKEKTITVTAILPAETYTVTFDYNDRVRDAFYVEVDQNGLLIEPEKPELENYNFIGWSTLEETLMLWDFASDLVIEDFTLYAIWESAPQTFYMVTYYLNDDTNDVFQSDFVADETLTFISEVPVRDGYVFIGWYYDMSLKSEALNGDALTQAISLYAGWQEIVMLNVTFELNDGSNASFEVPLEYGNLVQKPQDPSLANHIFVGWSINPLEFIAFDFENVIITKDLTLYAVYESTITEYVVTYYLNDDTNDVFFVDESINGYVYLISDEPNLDGFIFNGWYKDQLCEVVMGSFEEINEDISIYACWVEHIVFTVTFEMGTDEVDQFDPQVVVVGTYAEYPLPDPWRMDFHFLGWFIDLDFDNLFDFETTPIYEDVVLYAKWMSMFGEFFEITYYMNDGTAEIFTIDNVSEGSLFLMWNDPVRPGFIFDGWALDEEGLIVIEDGYYVDQDLSIYAQWSDSAPQLEAPQNLTYAYGVLTFDEYELVDGQVTAIGFHIYVDGVHSATAFTNSHDISHLLTQSKTYEIQVIAKGDATLYLDSNLSSVLEVVIVIHVEEEEHFTYFDNGVGLGLTITGLTDAGKAAIALSLELIIPDKIGTKYVTIIGASAFYNLLYDLFESEPEDEFEGEPLSELSFTKVVIPNSVTHIEQDAFAILITDELILSNRLEYIGVGAFMSLTGIDHLMLPDTLKEIDVSAFYMASIKTLYIGEYLERIGHFAFAYNYELHTVNFSILSRLVFIGNNAFESCWEITEIILPHSVKTIGDNVFSFCTSLFSITLSNSLEFIGASAFNGCSSLRVVWSYSTIVPVLGSNDVFPFDQNISFPYQFQEDSMWAPYFEN